MARHALLIGVSRFEDERLAKLNAPASDVEAFGAVLRDPERCAFTGVAVSIDEDYLAVRDRMAALFDDRDPDDLLLLYYSGHGILGRGNRLFLATPGSNLDRPQARSLSSGELRELMDQSRAEQQVMVLDCCHSGAFAEGAKGAAAPAVTEQTFEATAGGRYVLAAATAQQFAWDGGTLREGSAADRHLSRFTSWLVDGLGTGQAAPDDEQVTMDAVFRYVCRRAKAEGSPSTPQRYVDRGTGDVVIARNPAAAGPAWQELLGKLGSSDWNERATAAAAVGRMAQKPGPAAARAREALLDRLGEERDYKVRSVLLRALELDPEQGPKPHPEPPKPDPEPPKRPTPDPEPPELNDRERGLLADAGISRERWATLPPPVLERVRIHARALRATFWLNVLTYAVPVFDVGALGNLSDPTAIATVWSFLAGQVAAGVVGLVPAGLFGWASVKVVPPPASVPYAALVNRYVIVKSGRAYFEHRRLRRFSAVILVAGLVTCLIAVAVQAAGPSFRYLR